MISNIVRISLYNAGEMNKQLRSYDNLQTISYLFNT